MHSASIHSGTLPVFFCALMILSSGPLLAQSSAVTAKERVEQLERRFEELAGVISSSAEIENQVEQLQERIESMTEALEQLKQVQELQRQIGILAAELESLRMGEEPPEAKGEGMYGMGAAASKVYQVSQGLSVGGYGEMLYENFSGEREDGQPSRKKDAVDFLRGVLYVGYKFSDKWVMNSELEFEHASTSASGSASVEFAYLDYLWKPSLSFRSGLLLLPVGLYNELHEPPQFPFTERPNVEKAILPTTWRENGIGVFGKMGGLSYRSYLVNGLRGAAFSSSGIRGGRQKGANALAEDVAWVGRLDWDGTPGFLIGASAYIGNSGQGLVDASGQTIDASTRLLDVHATWKFGGLGLRGLWARGTIGDAARLNEVLGYTGSSSVGSRLNGYYLEASYDMLNRRGDGQAAFSPFLRWETLDTQDQVPAGYARNPSRKSDILTLGASYWPMEQLVLKFDFQNWSNDGKTSVDQWNLGLGYIY